MAASHASLNLGAGSPTTVSDNQRRNAAAAIGLGCVKIQTGLCGARAHVKSAMAWLFLAQISRRGAKFDRSQTGRILPNVFTQPGPKAAVPTREGFSS